MRRVTDKRKCSWEKFLYENAQQSLSRKGSDSEIVRKISERSKNKTQDLVSMRLIVVKSEREIYHVLSLIQKQSMEEIM